MLATTNFTAFVQRKEESLKLYQNPQRLIFNLTVLTIITGILIFLRLWIMNFEQPTFKEMDNPVAAAESLLVKVYV